MAVFEHLTLDGGVLAAEDEDENGLPAGEVFDHPAMLHLVKLSKAGWGNDVLRRLALRVLIAENGRERPEVVGALGPEEMVGGDGRDGVVDDGGEDGYRSSRRQGSERKLGRACPRGLRGR